MQISSANSPFGSTQTNGDERASQVASNDTDGASPLPESARITAAFTNSGSQSSSFMNSMNTRFIQEDGTVADLDPGENAVILGANDVTINTQAVPDDPDAEILILGTTSNSTISGSTASEQIFLTGDRNKIYTGFGDDTVWVSGADKLVINTGYGNDTVRVDGNTPLENSNASGGSSAVYVNGEAGDDHIEVLNLHPTESGDNTGPTPYGLQGRNVHGGGGNDYIEIKDSSGVNAHGQDFQSHIIHANDDDTFSVTNSDDINLSGGVGDDTFFLDALSTNISVHGGDGTDVLYIDKPLDPNNYEIWDPAEEFDIPVRTFEISPSDDATDTISVAAIECIEFNNGYRMILREDGKSWVVVQANVPKGQEPELTIPDQPTNNNRPSERAPVPNIGS